MCTQVKESDEDVKQMRVCQVTKRDKALRRAEGDMRAVEEERDVLLLRAKIAEGSPALPPPVAGRSASILLGRVVGCRVWAPHCGSCV